MPRPVKLSQGELKRLVNYYYKHGLFKTAKKYQIHYTTVIKILNKHNVPKIKGGHKANICINCKRSARFIEFPCPWAHKFEPVEGWTAAEVDYNGFSGNMKTYKITQCPLYMPDDEGE